MPGPLPRRSMMSRILARKVAARLSSLPVPAPVSSPDTPEGIAPPVTAVPVAVETVLIPFPMRSPIAGEKVSEDVPLDDDDAAEDLLVLDDSLLADIPGPLDDTGDSGIADFVEEDDEDLLLLDDSLLAEFPEPQQQFTLHDDLLPEPVVLTDVAEDAPPGLPVGDCMPAAEDLLLLDDSYLAPSDFPVAIPLPEPEPRPPEPEMRHLLEDVLAVLTVTTALAPPAPDTDQDAPPVMMEPELAAPEPYLPLTEVEVEAGTEIGGEDDVLLLDESFETVTPLSPPSPASPRMEALTPEEMAELIAAATPDEAGDLELPSRIDSLSALLLNPSDDFQALDLLKNCWPSQTSGVSNRALLAVAVNLSRNFGKPGKLPMASARAWRQLDPDLFQQALVRRLAAIGEFITDWQKSQAFFLTLDFSEIELIEYLFETIHPGFNMELLASVMEFKVLSGRRLGLLRRIPFLCRRIADGVTDANRDSVMVELAHRKALLERIIHPAAFRPVAEAAQKSLDEVAKLMKQVATPPSPAPAPGTSAPLPLGRI